jgi:hypothetical protein
MRVFPVLLLLWTGSGTAGEKEAGIELEAAVTFAERYIWRGLPLNQQYVLQPSLTVGGSGLYLQVWTNMDLTDWGGHRKAGYGDETGHFSEIDYLAGYEAALFEERLLFGFGFANYTFPRQRELGAAATTEIYGCVGLGIPLSPTLTAYVDEDQAEGAAYLSLDINHIFNLWEEGEAKLGFEVNGHLGWANHKFIKTYYTQDNGRPLNLESRFHDWMFSGGLPLTLPGGLAVTPAYVYTSIMTDELRKRLDAAELDKEAGYFTVIVSLSAGL